MSKTLYRIYRPTNFEEVVNQDHIKTTLINEIKSDRLAHAYLFCGPRGIGKTTLARIFAKALNCEKLNKKTAEPCLKCNICQSLRQGNFMDLIEIDAASHTGVDNVRENIIETARLMPSQGLYKIFIIDEVHMLSASAFNALLKIIEEPPSHVVFILATTEIHKMPLTVISRCQRFDFKKISIDLMVKRLGLLVKLEKRKVTTEVLEAIARQSDGSLRDAESLLGQILTLGAKEINISDAELVLPISNLSLVRELAELIIKKETAKGVDLLNKVIAEGVDLTQFTDDLIELWRQLLLVVIKAESAGLESVDEETKKWLIKYRDELEASYVCQLIELAISARRRQSTEVTIITLPLEIMVVKACGYEEDVKVNEFSDGPPLESQSESIKVKKDIKEPPQKKENVKKIIVSSETGSLAEIKKIWPKIYEVAKVKNTSLAFILKLTKPIKMTKNILKVGLAYQLHLKKIKDRKVSMQLEEIITSLYGKAVVLDPILVDDEDMKRSKDNDDVTGVLTTFGGRVVE